ncbi:MAG: hypothetical protein IT445_17525 [Phycisphaeraceae bacterium]|nr:hypothetical protein [Phycisphaeraceae bacterium]
MMKRKRNKMQWRMADGGWRKDCCRSSVNAMGDSGHASFCRAMIRMPEAIPHPPSPIRHRAGFTIMEMIVAFSIAAFMVFVFHAIFNEASNAARRSVQTSDFLHKAMAFEEQLQLETTTNIVSGGENTNTGDPPEPVTFRSSHMLGPFGSTDDPTTPLEPGGVLIIVQHRFDGPTGNGIPMRSDADAAGEPDVQYRANVRSDQLLFVYDQSDGYGRKLTPIAPAYADNYGGDLTFSIDSNYVRIWYGHAALTSRDGNYRTSGSPLDDLGEVDGVNQFPINWTLARHALFTAGDDDNDGVANMAGSYQTYYVETGNSGQFPPSGSLGLQPDDNVVGYTSIPHTLSMGLTDVTARPWTGVTGTSTAGGAFLDTANAPTTAAYNLRAVSLAFVNSRMQVNPAPDINNASMTNLSNFTCWTAARTHPIYMNNVSDFVVEFAHDYFQNQSYTPNNPSPDGRIDTYYNDDGELQIRWYSLYPNFNGTGTSLSNRAGANNPDYPVTFYPPRENNNPAHVVGGSFPYAGQNNNNGGILVWGQAGSQGYNNGNPAIEPINPRGGNAGPSPTEAAHRWPWLLRIRYRLHDRHGEFRSRVLNEGSTDPSNPQMFELGQWFEVIVPVNHQPR